MIQIESREKENAKNLKSFVMTLGSYYTVSLYLLFSLVDSIFYTHLFWEFFAVRITVVASILAVRYWLRRLPETVSFKLLQSICSIPFIVCAASIYYMMFRIQEPLTTYWGGLAIIVAGLSIGFAFTWPFYLINVAVIVLLFVAWSVVDYAGQQQLQHFLNPTFLFSISVVCVTGRWFYFKLSMSDYENRLKLAEEIENRNRIITEKTAESVRLNALSKQFSPQIIQSIRSGQISLSSKIHRSEICAIFVDIKDSTVKFSTLDRDDLQKIIAMYMEDVMSVFLKYDITIDKFLGDGVMGFSNDPVPQSDYLERVICAAIDLKNIIELKQETYSRFWGSDFEVRIGISSGYASIGFYGSDAHVKSYTAIGRVINLASRVNGIAPANQVAISSEILGKIKEVNASFLRDYNLVDMGYQTMKGFEHEKIKVLTIDRFKPVELANEESCPYGHGALVFSQLENGHFVMKCKYCDFIMGDEPVKQVSEAA